MTRDHAANLWASGHFTLRMIEPGGSETLVPIRRPFAVIGRAPGGDVVIEDPAISGRHLYFHLDRFGVFAVDLATRTGAEVGPAGGPAGWLNVGDVVDFAGRRVELVEWHYNQDPHDIPTNEALGPINPLDEARDARLATLTLYPEGTRRDALELGSRLVFAGRSSACGVTIEGAAAMRVQCALVRGRESAYVVDLVGRGTWRNDRPVVGAEALRDGDALMIGSSRFQCRIDLPGDEKIRTNVPALGSFRTPPATLEPIDGGYLETGSGPPLHLIPAEAQATVLAWMMGQIQARQDDAMRRQSDFQLELVKLVAEIHRDNHSMLSRHLEKTESLQREVSHLRDEIQSRYAPRPPAATPYPRNLPRPTPAPLNLPPLPPVDDPAAAADWLLNRVSQIDQDNRRGWKDLLGRLTGRKDG